MDFYRGKSHFSYPVFAVVVVFVIEKRMFVFGGLAEPVADSFSLNREVRLTATGAACGAVNFHAGLKTGDCEEEKAVPPLLPQCFYLGLDLRIVQEFGSCKQAEKRIIFQGFSPALLPVHQCHHRDDIISGISGEVDCLEGRSPGGAYIIYDNHPGPGSPVKALNEFLGSVFFGLLADNIGGEKWKLFFFGKADCRNSGNNRVGPEGQTAYGFGPDPPFFSAPSGLRGRSGSLLQDPE